MPALKKAPRSLLAWLLPVLLAGCSTTSAAPEGGGNASALVSGTVTYVQRVALPHSATIKVQLIDVSRADAAAIVIGEQVIQTAGKQVPFSFAISYDAAKIDPRVSYAVSARIEDGGKLLFINDRRYAVITRGATSHVDVVVRPVASAAPR